MTDTNGQDRSSLSRRAFLSTATIGIGVMAFPMIVGTRTAHSYEMGQSPHPNISPLRVVGLQDESMTTGEVIRRPWAAQEKVVNAKKVKENIDRLTCSFWPPTSYSPVRLPHQSL